MAYSKEGRIANATLVLRIFTLFLLAASVVVMATNNFKLSNGTKTTFKDLIAYRYVIATAMIGFIYTAFQIPFAIYHVCTEKRLIRNDCLPEFDFYADKMMSFLLASGVGAGFAVTYEFKKSINNIFNSFAALGVTGLDELKSKTISFLNRGNIATGILFVGFICMALLSILSSITRNSSSSRGIFFR